MSERRLDRVPLVDLILIVLKKHPNLTATQIAARLGKRRASVCSLLKDLTREGKVVKFSSRYEDYSRYEFSLAWSENEVSK